MGIGTFVQVPGLAKDLSRDKTLVSRESSPEEQIRQQLLESRFGPELFFRSMMPILLMLLISVLLCYV